LELRLSSRRYEEKAVSDKNEQRIEREESEWNAPKLFILGFVFLGICIAVIYGLASLN
jgi:hypothetical protein